MVKESVQTTVLIVEFLIAGALVSLALVVFAYSFFPDQTQDIFDVLVQYQLPSTEDQYQSAEPPSIVYVPIAVLLTTIFIAIAYGVGILFEYIGLTLFEGWHDEIKRDHMKKYLKELEDDKVDLSKSPILRKFEGKSPEEITKEQARSCIGPMRFYVLMKSPELYQDIASQLHRLRLIRIMFFVEFILMVAVAWQVLRNLTSKEIPSLPLMFTLVFLLIVLITNFKAILSRFSRYCRAVERSYKALLVDQGISVTRTTPRTGYERKIRNTKIAHQEYPNPLVGIVVFLFNGGEIAVFEENGTWKLPESYGRGDEYLEEAVRRVLTDYLSNSQQVNVKSYALLSGRDYRQDVYQYDYVTCVRIDKSNIKPSIQPKWIPKDDLKNINIDSAHKKLLKNHSNLINSKDEFIIPVDPPNLARDENLLKGTKKIHAEQGKMFPMPSITVDGILLKFSKSCEFEGIILEKRSKKADREPGKWAFPGGFVEGHETVLGALIREVNEEIGINLEKNQLISAFKFGTGPDRDPTYFVWTQFLVFYTMKNLYIMEKPYIVFHIMRKLKFRLKEIEDVKVFPLREIPWNEMAFDHGDVLTEFIDSIPYYIEHVLKMCP